MGERIPGVLGVNPLTAADNLARPDKPPGSGFLDPGPGGIDPPLPLSQLRTHQQVLEVRTDQLRCTAKETRAFFREVMGIQPDVLVGLRTTDGPHRQATRAFQKLPEAIERALHATPRRRCLIAVR